MTQDMYNYKTQKIHKRDSRDKLHNKVQVLSIVLYFIQNELIELGDDPKYSL